MTTTCSKCGTPIADGVKFCGSCGTVVAPPSSAQTLMEFAAPPEVRQRLDPDPTQPAARALDPSSGRAQPAAPARVAAKTMLGVAAQDFRIPPAPAPTPAPAPAPAPEPVHAGRAAMGKTMLGVATPGIAPIAPGQSSPAQPPTAGAAQQRPGGTILGVALPGIAPLHPGAAATAQPGFDPKDRAARSRTEAMPVPIVPAPPPLVDDEPVPSAPVRKARTGVPVAWVAAGLAGALLVAGTVIAFVWRDAPPIVARPALDAQGKETLHLTCDSCPDGTQVSLDTSKAEFKGAQADLLLPRPLVIGDNPFALDVDRPGMGRDEKVKLTVPVAFRLRADMSNVAAKPPVITIKVEAASSNDVVLDGKPVTLDAHGQGSYVIDIRAETEGPSREVKRIDRQLPYVVTPRDKAGKAGPSTTGTLPAAVSVVALQLDAPSLHAVTDQKDVLVAGQTMPNASVIVNGEPVHVDPSGAFATTVVSKAAGEVPIEVIASTPQAAARSVHLTVKRVQSLEEEAKALEAKPLLSYDAVQDVMAHVGQDIVVEGPIVDTRLAGHQTILVITDRRGCAAKADPNQCLARVLVGGEDKHKKGDIVRIFGRITRAVQAQNGKTVPEIEADLLAKARGG